MKKIDKQLESISDDALISTSSAKAPAEKAKVAAVQRTTTTFGVFARLMLAVALGLGMLFWPYSARCGPGLGYPLGAVTVVVVGGVWCAVWTWRHRAAKAHVLSLLLVMCGGSCSPGWRLVAAHPATRARPPKLTATEAPAALVFVMRLTRSPNFHDITT